MLLVDLSPSISFGTVRQLKSELAAHLCSLLAFCALKNNDRIGLILFTDRVEKFVPPDKGLPHLLRILREVLFFAPKGKGTDVSSPLEYLSRVLKRKTVSFIISDFYGPNFENTLSKVGQHHDLIAITLTDPFELALPRIGMVRLADPETGQTFLLDTSDEAVQKAYRRAFDQRTQERKKQFQRAGVDHIDLRTDQPYLPPLIRFFRDREGRYGR